MVRVRLHEPAELEPIPYFHAPDRNYAANVGNRIRRVARPVDRIVMGMVMGFIVFVIERAVMRGTRKDIKRDRALSEG